MTIRLPQLIGLLALVGSAFSAAPAQVVRRFPADTFWRRIWTAGAKDDGLFVEPRFVVVNQERVTVLDQGTREVQAFDRRTGRPLLRLKARGSGPGEFKRPAHLVSTGDGFAIADHANSRLTSFDADGRLRWDIVIPEIFRAADFCFVSPTRVLVQFKRRDSSVVVFDSAGRRLSVRSVPWSVPRPSTMSFLHVAHLSPLTPDGACVLAPYFGAEWAVVPADAASGKRIAVHRYVEPGGEPVVIREETPIGPNDPIPKAVPEVTETPPIAKGALLHGDTIIVVGARTKLDAHRLLDYYDRDGRYLYSRRLPFPLVSLAIDRDGTFFGSVIEENLQAVIAFRPERLNKEVQRALDRAQPKVAKPVAKPVTTPPRDTGARRSPPAPARRRGSP
jgi:hypothetical protein